MALHHSNSRTIPALRHLVTDSYRPHLSTVYVENLYDIKEWMSLHLGQLKYHRRPYAFRFKRNGNWNVCMHYRQLAHSDQTWKGKKETKVGLLS